MPGRAEEEVTGRAILEARGIVKRFGTVAANAGIDLSVAAGEIHALLGENGAGKSTLVKILYGALAPDEGEVCWQGRPIRFDSPAQARAAGLGMVFQHFSLFEALTVAENVALGLPAAKPLREVAREIEAVSRDFGLALKPDRVVHDLSVGERQRIEIVRALLQGPRLLIMDEPTSVLTPQEAELLFATLRRLARQGCAILYITHRLDEVRALCDRATVLRQGRVVASVLPAEQTAASLARLMVGAEVQRVEHGRGSTSGAARLQVRELSLPPENPFGMSLASISLTVRAGEVVGIAGVAGNGQSELFQALSGERASGPGKLLIDGRPAGALDINERRSLGAAFVPEERLGHGAVPRLPLSGNVTLTRHRAGGLAHLGLLSPGRARRAADAIAAAFDVRKAGRDPEAASLSGGNLQKFVIGRELLAQPGVLVVNQPTWGVDAGAAGAIRQALVDLASRGSAVLVISQDLDEILEIADRIAVISQGRVSEPAPAAALTLETIGLMMGGAHPEQVEAAASIVPVAAREGSHAA